MHIVCLDLEGVLTPEIWIEFSQRSGIPELARTTRDEPNYDTLMHERIEILKRYKLGLSDVQDAIVDMRCWTTSDIRRWSPRFPLISC